MPKELKRKSLTFRSYCERGLSNYYFNELSELIGITKHMVTRYLDNPRKMNLKALKIIAAGLQVKPLELINTYGCGLDGMSASDYRKLLNQTEEQ